MHACSLMAALAVDGIGWAEASMSDHYDYIPPEGWQVENRPDHVLLRQGADAAGCVIQILPLQVSSGDLKQDANAVFEMMYPGWNYQKAGEQKFTSSRGVLPKGLRYFMKEAAMNATGADGRYLLEEGAALVVQAGAQVAIVAVRHRSVLAHNDCLNRYETWRRFFNSFTVKGAEVVPAAEKNQVAERLVGVWSQAGGGAAGDYVFAANGRYAFAGGLGSSFTRSEGEDTFVHIRSHAWSGDGSYEISGQELILRRRGEEESQGVPLRFEEVNHGGAGWKDRMWLLKTDRHGRTEVCYEKK